jgi:hypothetical protein
LRLLCLDFHLILPAGGADDGTPHARQAGAAAPAYKWNERAK